MPPGFGILELFVVVAAAYCLSSLRIIKQYERGVSFFLGRYWNTKGPGLKFLPSFIAHMHRVSLRVIALDIPPQDVITRDNVSVKVNAVLYMKVKDPAAAIIQIENYLYATSQLAQTTLRAVLGQHQLDELLAERERINETLKEIIDKRTDEWGIEVSAVEVKDVDLPKEMQRAMARQAEAERERRAKVINAEGELQASEKLTEAARIIGSQPAAIQLRYLQTVAEVASENNSTMIFPLPIDLLRPFIEGAARLAAAGAQAPPANPALATGTRPALSAPTPEAALLAAREGAEERRG
jgi:regulator of protease activity HflC (stomatin/prohibitin superfamily)